MARKEGEETSRRHIWLYDADWEWLVTQFGDNVGISRAIRTIIRTYRKQIEAKAAEHAKRPAVQLELPVDPSEPPEPR